MKLLRRSSLTKWRNVFLIFVFLCFISSCCQHFTSFVLRQELTRQRQHDGGVDAGQSKDVYLLDYDFISDRRKEDVAQSNDGMSHNNVVVKSQKISFKTHEMIRKSVQVLKPQDASLVPETEIPVGHLRHIGAHESSEFAGQGKKIAGSIEIDLDKKNKSMKTLDSESENGPQDANNVQFISSKVSEQSQNSSRLTWTTDGFITVTSSSDIGGALFAYASLLGIARSYGRLPIVPRDCLLSRIFKITFTGFFQSKSWRILTQDTFDRLDGHGAPIPQTHLKLRGKFQSYKYFDNMEVILKQEFTFHGEILAEGKAMFKSLMPDINTTAVGIYISKQMTQDEQAVKDTVTHFLNAMEHMRQMFHRVIFLVASDDVTWCRQVLTANDVIFIPQLEQGLLLVILSLCSGSIVSETAIGWWAAWLSNGYVVFSNLCDVEEGTNRMLQYHPRDWIAMPKCDVWE